MHVQALIFKDMVTKFATVILLHRFFLTRVVHL